MIILGCILIFFLGVSVGFIIARYHKDDAYEVGYIKGKEEENKRIMAKLEEYRKGEAV